jgi:uncharacterized protein DUF5335
MSNAAVNLLQISEDQWNAVLSAITRENRGAHGRLEVVGQDVGDQVETENRPFDGIAADVKDSERVVWIHIGGVNHAVHGVTALRMIPRTGEYGPVIEVEDKEGVKTILTLESPEAYRLPPAEVRHE